MGLEIERKYTVTSDVWRMLPHVARRLEQGYLAYPSATGPEARVRVSLPVAGEGGTATFTVKGPGKVSRQEIEVAIPIQEATHILALLATTIKKVRHTISWHDVDIEVDVFEGALTGLTTAEIELPSEDHLVALPDWFGIEVTGIAPTLLFQRQREEPRV